MVYRKPRRGPTRHIPAPAAPRGLILLCPSARQRAAQHVWTPAEGKGSHCNPCLRCLRFGSIIFAAGIAAAPAGAAGHDHSANTDTEQFTR